MTKTKKKIAVVEDEQALQSVLAEWLDSEGYEPIPITTGRQAIEEIPKRLPDLILLDILLPEIDGLTVMRQLRENPETATIPVVILSNLGDPAERREAEALGARDYLVKAEHDFPSIKRVIERVLQNGV